MRRDSLNAHTKDTQSSLLVIVNLKYVGNRNGILLRDNNNVMLLTKLLPLVMKRKGRGEKPMQKIVEVRVKGRDDPLH